MANYRLYRLDGAGRILGAEWVTADGDGDAIEKARGTTPTGRCEVWDGKRLVARFDAADPERPVE